MKKTWILLAGLALVVAACGDSEGGDDTTAAPTTTAPAPTTAAPATTPAPTTAAPTAGLAVASTGIGDVLVDGAGFTLYVFANDTDGASVCYGDCETNWPPLYEDEVGTVGDGVDEALVGTTDRDDGTVQVTYGGHPLYRFAADSAPGDTNGQLVGDVWFAATADGGAIGMDDAGAAASQVVLSSDGDGY
jgi:predicted lipoprotein with Yx(FWY)xxD motif